MKSLLFAAAQAVAVTVRPVAAACGRPTLLGLAIALGVGAQSPVLAQATPSVLVTQTDATSLRVHINNPTSKPAKMRVSFLGTGRSVLSETHEEPVYSTLLKFEKLPAGKYSLQLRVGADRYRYTVEVQRPTPETSRIAVRELTTRLVAPVLASTAQ